MLTLIRNIKKLVGVRTENKLLRGKELADLQSIDNAYLVIDNGMIADYGQMDSIKNSTSKIENTIEAPNQFILPAWCDSHTHLVFAAGREEEFVNKIKGMSYAEIAARGGGILNSAKKLSAATEDELFDSAWQRLQEISKLGTGAVEIKSGYGLSLESELKMLRVIRKLKERSSLLIRSTFLGAHAYPLEYKEDHQGYIANIINEMLPAIAKEKLADYIDVFCEKNFFSPLEMKLICEAGLKYGLRPKLHVNQLHSIGGIEAGIAVRALSLDHLEVVKDEEIELLSSPPLWGRAGGGPVCSLLPAAAFFLGTRYPPARKLIDSGCAIALASDYNPGSSPSGNMNLVVSMACIQMKMLPEEAIHAATLNGAYAMGLEGKAGSITVGKNANLIFTKPIVSVASLPYSFGTNLIDKVMINGEFV